MRHLSMTTLSVSLLLALACSGNPFGGLSGNKKGTTTTHVPSSDGTTSTAPPPPPDRNDPDECDPPYDTPAPNGCVMARISCGDTIKGNNGFGQRNFGNEFYVHHFCSPQRLGYDDSPEAIYQITVPGDKKAIFHLQSDCAELDVSAMGWNDASTCPSLNDSRLHECEMVPKTGGEKVFVTTVTRPQDYLVVVDGRNGDEGNFTLQVECVDYR